MPKQPRKPPTKRQIRLEIQKLKNRLEYVSAKLTRWTLTANRVNALVARYGDLKANLQGSLRALEVDAILAVDDTQPPIESAHCHHRIIELPGEPG